MLHLLYTTNNLINNKEYTGIHSTNNRQDNYLGTGLNIKKAIIKYGKNNFERLIIGEFRNRKILSLIESWVVDDEYINLENTYNISPGGIGNILKIVGKESPSVKTRKKISESAKGKIVVKDIEGNTLKVSVNDERYLSGELVPVSTGMVTVYDEKGTKYRVIKNHPDVENGKLKMKSSFAKNKFRAKNSKGEIFYTERNDIRFIEGELKSVMNGTFPAKDKNGNFFRIYKDDVKYLSGELVGIGSGVPKGQLQIKKVKNTWKTKKFKWIHMNKVDRRIEENNLIWYLADGWKLGRTSNPNKRNITYLTCPVCQKTMNSSNYKKYKHGEKCKNRNNGIK